MVPRWRFIDSGLRRPHLNTPYVMQLASDGKVLSIVEQWPRPWPNLQAFEEPQEFSWSPLGKQIAFIGRNGVDGYTNLYVGDGSDWEKSNSETSVVQYTEEYHDFPGVIYGPAWSSDGQKIAVSFNGPSSGVGIMSVQRSKAIYITDASNSMLSHVENPDPWADFPSDQPKWFPDGKSLIFTASTSTAKDRTALFKVDSNGENLKLLLPNGVRNPVISTDGQSIAYIEYSPVYEIGTIGRIVRVDEEGKHRTILATIKRNGLSGILKKQYIRDLSWSPDGKWLTFVSNATGPFQPYVVSVNGGQALQIISFPGNVAFPQWRPK